jgi:hypothetical protein
LVSYFPSEFQIIRTYTWFVPAFEEKDSHDMQKAFYLLWNLQFPNDIQLPAIKHTTT